MSDYAKILSLAYDSAGATKTFALKSYYRSVRLIKTSNTLSPDKPSYITNILLCGKCVDLATRCIYVFYIDTLTRIRQSTGEVYNSSWIIEINVDTRAQTVVYYDKYNDIGFDPNYRIRNARVVHGRIIWTDNKNPIYQMDIARAKKSFYYGIGYGQYPDTVEWSMTGVYGIDQIVSNGNSFYRSTIDSNSGVEPRNDSGLNWVRLCAIEDAYYSMKVENFYFEAMPPKYPPVVAYRSDNTRKINNLRQTLFQVAYRYVYMDWRKSTYSPASIVVVPQAEENAATGLANEQISLNNELEITVNAGGEEVRAVEIIGRSSKDVSKWFLIDIIEKFKTQEKAGEDSSVLGTGYASLGLSIPTPTVLSSSVIETEGQGQVGVSLPAPTVFNSFISLSESDITWDYDEYYPTGVVDVTVNLASSLARITNIPSWLTVFKSGVPVFEGSEITDGDSLELFPTVENTGEMLSGEFVITGAEGDEGIIAISQGVNPAGVQVFVTATIPPPLSITDNGCTGTYGSPTITIRFTPNHPDYSAGQSYTVNYTILRNGGNVGTGSFTVIEQQANTKNLTMGTNAQNGDNISVYLQYNS